MLRCVISLIFVVVSCKATSEPLPPPPLCYAEDGHDCIFPFVWQGVPFYECTKFDSSNGKHWCATKTKGGEAVEYSDCELFLDNSCYEFEDPPCTTVAGPQSAATCVFPFTYNGVTHYECAYWPWGGRRQEGTHWCSTKTDRNDNHVNGQGNYGFCDCSVDQCGCFQIPNDDVQYSDAPVARGSPSADQPPAGDPVE